MHVHFILVHYICYTYTDSQIVYVLITPIPYKNNKTLDVLWVIDLCDMVCLQHCDRCFLCRGNLIAFAFLLLFTAARTVAVQSREAHHTAGNR